MALNGVNGPRKGSRYHRLDDIPKDSFTPRTYQIELLDAALRRNTILCLGSVESKIFLALMVAKQMASVTRLPLEGGGKRTFFITDTNDGINTISVTLPHHTDLSVGKFCDAILAKDSSSQTGCTSSNDICVASSLQKVVEENSIIVTTGSLFLMAVENNNIDLHDVNLLIFDDCHKTVDAENHPYINIVSKVASMDKDKTQPHILGVTASIAGTECSQPESLQHTISTMEKSLMAHAETSMLILSERFGCRPKEFVIECQEIADDQPLLADELEDILLYNLDFFEDCQIAKDENVDFRDPTEIPKKVLVECHNILQVLGSWCTSSIAEYFIMQLDKIIKFEKNDIHKKFLRCVCTTLRGLTKFFEKNFKPDYDIEEFLQYTTSKVRETAKILRNYRPEVDFMIINNDNPFENDGDFSDMSDDNEDDEDSLMSGSDGEDQNEQGGKSSISKPMHIAVRRTADGGHERIMTFSEEEERNLCGVIFVENHFIAFGLNKLIEEICSWDENLCFVKSSHIMGHGLGGASNKPKSSKTYKRQEETLRKFRMQERNLIIATKELEEGIDIPKCNLVVCFDPPTDYRSYTLSKGRARARDASYYILLDEETHSSFNSNLNVFKGIEQVLLGENKTQESHLVETEEDICMNDEELYDILPPYSSGCAQVDMSGAISLINKYCAKLPSDAFTHLTPQCRVEKMAGDQQKFRGYLRLPINSPVKEELEGPEMPSIKLAERAVALCMCEILHKKGELDENLVPVGKEMFLYEEEEEWADEEDQTGQARPGTTKRKQYYVKKVADALMQSQPKPNQSCCLYLFNLKLTGRITDEQNTRGRVIYAPEDTTQTLGVLLSKPIPQMPCFPIYTRSGEVTVSVDLLKSGLILNDEEIDCLLKFHQFVFSGVLHLIKEPMEFSPSFADIGSIIVPLDGTDSLHIDWDFVDKVITFSGNSKRAGLTKSARKENFEFHTDDFRDAVVMPSYRNIDQPQHFYVAEIRQDLNPLSPFPSPELYKTFQDYYTTKYGLIITNTVQPLLDVDHTSARLNLLTPRYMNQKGVALPTSSAETKRARRENLQQKQILVPELCDVHVFPASLWRKTVCLPAILYRTNCLLLAEELRCKISKETGIGIEVLPYGFRFPKLDFGFETSPEKLKEAESNNEGKSHSCTTSEKSEGTLSLSINYKDNDDNEMKENDKSTEQNVSLESEKMTIVGPNNSKSSIELAANHKSLPDLSPDNILENSVTCVKHEEEGPPGLCQGSKDNVQDINHLSVENLTLEIDAIENKDNGKIEDQKQLVNGFMSEKDSDFPPCDEEDCSLGTADSKTLDTTTQCNSGDQATLSSNCNRFSPRQQQTASSKCFTPPSILSKESLSSPHSDPSILPSTEEESVAQMPTPLQLDPMHFSNSIDATIDSHIMNSPSPSIETSNSAARYTNAKDNQKACMQSSVDVSNNMKNGLLHMNPSGAINNVVNNQVLCAMSAVSLEFNSSESLLSCTSESESFFSCSSDSDSFLSCPSISSPVSPSSSSSSLSSSLITTSEPPFAQPTTTLQAAATSLSQAGNTTTLSTIPGNNASSLQAISADSSNSPPTSTAAVNNTSGFCHCHGKNKLEPLSAKLRSEEAPLQNGTSSNHFISNICAYQGCDHKIELCHQHALKPTSHPLSGAQTCASQSVCDKSSVSAYQGSLGTEDCSSLPSGQKSPLGISTSCHCNIHELSDNRSNISNENGRIPKEYIPNSNCFENGMGMLNGFCPEQGRDSADNVENEHDKGFVDSSFRTQDSSLYEEVCEPAIIMNTLSAELNSDLEIDLIEPGLNTSSTFHYSTENVWSDKNNWKGNNEWQQSKQQCSRGWDQEEKLPKSPFSAQSAGDSPENGDTDSSMLKDSAFIKFSFSGKTLNQDEKKDPDLVIDTWDSRNQETITDSLKTVKSLSVQSPLPKVIEQQSAEKNNIPVPAVEKMSLTENSNSSTFPISIWKSKKPAIAESERDPVSGNGLESLIGSSASSSNISLDEDRDLSTFIGPSPCLILQALTMSNANDFFSLERLETIGDSFLKYAITVYLYCSYPGIHEGKLSYLRSKQVSNYNLYRLGRRKNIAEYMVSTKFEPYENWLPPGFTINNDRRRGPVPKVVIVSSASKINNVPRNFFVEEGGDAGKQNEAVQFNKELEWIQQTQEEDQKDDLEDPNRGAAVPYSLQCHHGLPDKSVADCVEALIGCYLTTCGRKAALMFMSWLGLKVLPKKLSQGVRKENQFVSESSKSIWQQISEQEFDELQCPPSPMFLRTLESKAQLNHLLEGFYSLEEKLCYKFRDRSYLLQAFTHASYHYNTITDCYQRIEFLGDAILDYVITRHLYEDSQKYSPGILTDLRSALVNNNIFAALAVKWGFHCFFKAISPSLFAVIDKFVTKQKEKSHDDIDFDEEYEGLSLEDGDVDEGNEDEDNEEEVEMEIPKALGDIFESVAGAIYLDSGMSLDTVWRVYYRMMKPYIDKYLKSIPKSLVRELLEREPETAKFERPERTMNGKVRVTVNVVGKGVYSGIGRNYRIAKSAAAKKALRALRPLSQNGSV